MRIASASPTTAPERRRRIGGGGWEEEDRRRRSVEAAPPFVGDCRAMQGVLPRPRRHARPERREEEEEEEMEEEAEEARAYRRVPLPVVMPVGYRAGPKGVIMNRGTTSRRRRPFSRVSAARAMRAM
jgi:hypothetical protein